MTEYKCENCKKLQYTANTECKEPCIYCGGECKKTSK